MARAFTHLFGGDYLLECEGFEWLASVPCFCGAGAPTGPTDWHWHLVATAETFTELIYELWRLRPVEDEVEGVAA
jgi:hypothetical protein